MKPANNAPAYAAALYPGLAEIFRKHGYALAAHGSLAADFDLVAIPWIEEPTPHEEVLKEVCEKFSIRLAGTQETKNHGRVAYCVAIGFGECRLDLSFFPGSKQDKLGLKAPIVLIECLGYRIAKAPPRGTIWHVFSSFKDAQFYAGEDAAVEPVLGIPLGEGFVDITMPRIDSSQVTKAIQDQLAHRNFPSNPTNAARAGYLAACKVLHLKTEKVPSLIPTLEEVGISTPTPREFAKSIRDALKREPRKLEPQELDDLVQNQLRVLGASGDEPVKVTAVDLKQFAYILREAMSKPLTSEPSADN